jgi:hypothetical protein
MVSGNQIIAEIENSKIISFQIILIVKKTVTLCHEEIDRGTNDFLASVRCGVHKHQQEKNQQRN